MNNKLFKKINIDYILKNYFYLIVLLLLPLIFVSGFLYLIMPNYESMKVEIDTALSLENQYSELKINHLKKLKEYEYDFNLIDNKNLEKIKKILPYSPDMASIINEIGQISKNTGVDIEKIIFEEEKTDETSTDSNNINNKLKKINFSVNVKNGKDYKTFKNFMSEIESNVRLFNINNFYVTNDFNKYTFNITCYYKNI